MICTRQGGLEPDANFAHGARQRAFASRNAGGHGGYYVRVPLSFTDTQTDTSPYPPYQVPGARYRGIVVLIELRMGQPMSYPGRLESR